PPSEQLARAGIRAARVDGGFTAQADAWSPSWLRRPGLESRPLDAVDGCAIRRIPSPVRADPFFANAFDWNQNTSFGQRSAVRAVVLAEAGETILVNLPTGAGKSAVGFLSAFRRSPRGTTVIFVPTVSLVRDQEAELRQILAHREPPWD